MLYPTRLRRRDKGRRGQPPQGTGSHCLGPRRRRRRRDRGRRGQPPHTGDGEPLPEPKMRNQVHRAGAGNLPGGRGKVEEPLFGPKRRNQDHLADSIMGSRAQFFKRLTKILDVLGFGIAYFSQPRSLIRPKRCCRSEVVMVEILRVQHPQGHNFWGC